jgi:hypothetical protein
MSGENPNYFADFIDNNGPKSGAARAVHRRIQQKIHIDSAGQQDHGGGRSPVEDLHERNYTRRCPPQRFGK